MNADQKLRDILRAEADLVDPGAEGWNRIQTGIAARRRRTVWLRGSAVATAALAVLAVAIVARPGDDKGQGITDEPTPTPTVSSQPAPSTRLAKGIWPFTFESEVDAWIADHGSRTWLERPETTAAEFARTYLAMPNPAVAPAGRNRYSISRTVDGSSQPAIVTTVTVAPLRDGESPYAVFEADSAAVDIATVSLVRSPLVVRGTYRSVDPHFAVELRAAPDAAGQARVVARAFATTGPEGWTATLRFDEVPGQSGSLLVTDGSLADEGLASAAAVPVAFDTEPATSEPSPAALPVPDEFVGIEDGRVAVYSTATGNRVRFLTTRQPGGGAGKARLTEDGKSVVYVEGSGTCSAAAWIVPVSGGTPERLTPFDQGAVVTAWYEPRAAGPIYAVTRCDPNGVAGDRTDLAYRKEDGEDIVTRLAVPPASQLVVNSTWAVYAGTDGTLYGIDLANGGTDATLAPAAGCRWTAVTPEPADGLLLAAELCGRETRLIQLDKNLGRLDLVTEVGTGTVTSLDTDANGNLIFVRSDEVVTYLDSEPHVLARGVESATWR